MMLLVAACVSLALDAEFAADKNNRKQFVESINIGRTNISELTSRWGNVTSAGTAGSGNRPDQYYNWATGFNPNGSYITVTTSYDGIVKSVHSEGPSGPDNFKPGGLTAQATQRTEQNVADASSAPTPTTTVSKPVKQNTAQAMKAYSLTENATPQEFFARFGNPDDRETYPDGLEIWTYGRVPYFSLCSAAPFVLVDYNSVSKKFVQIRSNLPGFGC